MLYSDSTVKPHHTQNSSAVRFYLTDLTSLYCTSCLQTRWQKHSATKITTNTALCGEKTVLCRDPREHLQQEHALYFLQIKTMPLFTTFPIKPRLTHALFLPHKNRDWSILRRCWAQLQTRHCEANAVWCPSEEETDPLKHTTLWWQSYIIGESKKTLERRKNHYIKMLKDFNV